MIPIFINNVTYACPLRPQELSPQQLNQLRQLNQTTPVQLLHFLCDPTKSAKNQGQLYHFSRNLLQILCRVPTAVVRKTTLEDCCALIVQRLWPVVVATTEQTKGDKERSVVCGEEQIQIPRADRDINGELMPLGHISALQFCEATDLYMVDALRYAPLIVAILCPPNGCRYNERQAKKRAKHLQKLPISVALQLFAELNGAHAYLKKAFPSLYAPIAPKPERLMQEEQGEASTWGEVMAWLADYDPLRLQKLEQMNLYNFMHLAQCKINRNRLR